MVLNCRSQRSGRGAHEDRDLERQRHPRARDQFSSGSTGTGRTSCASRRSRQPSAQVPAALCEMQGYWCYWHGERAYSGVGLHVRKDAFAETARLRASRVRPRESHRRGAGRQTCIRVDLRAERRQGLPRRKCGSSRRWTLGRGDRTRPGGQLVLCGDMNVARTDRDVHPKERKPATIGQRPRSGRLFERILAAGLVDVGRALDPDNEQSVHVVGALAQPASAQHRLAPRLCARQRARCAGRASRARCLREFGTSDHAPVVAEFVPAAGP